jgi:hypothetical protein
MQTFVPSTTFERCARVLDYRRLGKQRVEAMQILRALEQGGGWSNHPAVLMWRGYEPALRMYLRTMILEWTARGYRNTMDIPRATRFRWPGWWTGPIHRTHRSNLLRKEPDHYRRYWPTLTDDLPYHWPVTNNDED